MKLLQIAIDRIDLFFKCSKITFSEQQILYTIKLKFGEICQSALKLIKL